MPGETYVPRPMGPGSSDSDKASNVTLSHDAVCVLQGRLSTLFRCYFVNVLYIGDARPIDIHPSFHHHDLVNAYARLRASEGLTCFES